MKMDLVRFEFQILIQISFKFYSRILLRAST